MNFDPMTTTKDEFHPQNYFFFRVKNETIFTGVMVNEVQLDIGRVDTIIVFSFRKGKLAFFWN